MRAILRNHLLYQETKAVRVTLVHLLAALGGFAVLMICYPQIASVGTRIIVVAIWAMCVLVVAAVAAVETLLHRREALLLAHDDGNTPADV